MRDLGGDAEGKEGEEPPLSSSPVGECDSLVYAVRRDACGRCHPLVTVWCPPSPAQSDSGRFHPGGLSILLPPKVSSSA